MQVKLPLIDYCNKNTSVNSQRALLFDSCVQSSVHVPATAAGARALLFDLCPEFSARAGHSCWSARVTV